MTKQAPLDDKLKGYRGCDDIDPRVVESDHRVANSLTMAAGLLRMQRRMSSDEAVRSAILCAEARLTSIASFHRYMYRHDNSRLNLPDYLAEVIPHIGAAIGIRCVLVVDAGATLGVSGRVAKRLTMIVSELALNARKHGYGGREDGCVTVELESDQESFVRLIVADGGVGLPEGFDLQNSDGLGMTLIFSLIHELNGSITSHTDGGARFTLTVPAG